MQESIIKTMKLSRWVVTLSLIYYFTCFVLFLNDGYSNVLTLRYQLFWIAGIITIGLTVLCSVIERKKSQEAEKTRIHLETYEIAIFAFLAACILSTVFSDYKYEAVWGNEGRLCGLFFLSICCFLYLIISRKLYFKTWLIDLFLFSSMLACIWGITDFFQLDIFNLKEGFYIVDKYNFVSSIGNVNTYTAFLAFVVGISSVLFMEATDRKKLLWYGGCFIVSLFAMIVGLSDNAYLALGALFGFLPYYAFRNNRGTRRYICMVAIFASVVQSIAWISVWFEDQVVPISSLFTVLIKFKGFIFIVLILWLFFAMFCKWDNQKNKKSVVPMPKILRIIWTGLILTVIISVIILLIIVNTSEDQEKYSAVANYLVLDDAWGTHRLYNWRLGIENYKKFSPIHKLFGYGPETYGIVTVTNNLSEMMEKFSEKYDNAHNEYLQFFITIGPIGLITYLSILFSSIRSIIKKTLDNPYAMAVVFAVICYCAQATVNLATPMTFPFVWIFLAMGTAIGRNFDTEPENASEG